MYNKWRIIETDFILSEMTIIIGFLSPLDNEDKEKLMSDIHSLLKDYLNKIESTVS